MAGEAKVPEGSEGRRLPVRRHKNTIVEKVKLNRVTLIYAETGSGKTSQVPQMLVEEGVSPILCTQPRRLAVVSVSKMVAMERGCVLGEEVGYHIGQLNRTSPRSKIVFQTSGVLLEELKARGVGALSRYKVVILDEVHERSVESDLVLCCVKLLLLRNKSIRLVLMSATADFKRYENYFSELGSGEKVERIAISSLATMVQQKIFNIKVKYLEQVVDMLGKKGEHLSMVNSMVENGCPFKKGTDIGMEIQNLIFDLIVRIHKTESDLQKSILVFLPTYRSLEEQWGLLKLSELDLEVYVLHSSIDIDQSIEAMEACHSVRKVILATDVAESSITIPGASFVIDSCRCLEIFWNNDVKRDAPRIVWESQSQADQRKGRTGRTCDGTVFRMVPRSVFNAFETFELPAMQLLSLRKQVLLLTCAETRALNDSMAFLQRCLNPPAPATVQNALEALVALSALEAPRDARGKYQPTGYGRLLAALPLSLEASMLVIEGSERELLSECAVIGALVDVNPSPIIHPFGSDADYSFKYFQKPNNGPQKPNNGPQKPNNGRPSRSSVLLANLIAFEFWQCIFKDKLRCVKLLQESTLKLKDVLESDVRDLEKQWCSKHHLSQFSLHVVSETTNCILEVMHRFRPQSITLLSGPPSYYTAYDFNHHCKGTSFEHANPDSDAEAVGDDLDTCTACPYVQSGVFHGLSQENELERIIVEVQSRYLQMTSSEDFQVDDVGNGEVQCVYFRSGSCSRGHSCSFSHSTSSKPSVCKFYLTGEGCRYGAQCRYLHDTSGSRPEHSIEFGQDAFSFETVCSYLPSGDGSVLIFGGDTLSYAERLNSCLGPSQIWAAWTDGNEEALKKFPSLQGQVDRLYSVGVEIVWDVDPTRLKASAADDAEKDLDWRKVKCIIFNFPFESIKETEQFKPFMQNFLAFVTVTQMNFRCNGLYLLMTMSTHEFTQWQVERAARDCFFFLESSFVVDSSFFGDIDFGNVKESFPPLKLVTYVFKLDLPVMRFLQDA